MDLIAIPTVSQEVLDVFSLENRKCIERLVSTRPSYYDLSVLVPSI